MWLLFSGLIVSDEKFAVLFAFVPVCKRSFFPLATFNIPFIFGFQSFHSDRSGCMCMVYFCLSVLLRGLYRAWDSLKVLDLWFDIFCYFRKISGTLQICFFSIVSFFSFWDSSYMYVKPFGIGPLLLDDFFFFLCYISVWIISIQSL